MGSTNLFVLIIPKNLHEKKIGTVKCGGGGSVHDQSADFNDLRIADVKTLHDPSTGIKRQKKNESGILLLIGYLPKPRLCQKLPTHVCDFCLHL